MSLLVRFTKQVGDKHVDKANIKLDVEINSRGVTAVFGPSGAGKTTLLRVIAGLEKLPDAKVKFNHQVWQDADTFIAPEHRHIGMVFQHPSLFEHLNVEQNIYFSEKLKANRNRKKHIDISQIITLLQLTPLLKRTPNTLSGGEQQRVAIARALATQPDLLLMDEPLSALDEKLKSEFLAYLEKLLIQLSIPVVYVSHSKAELARLSSQVVLINRGEVVGQGPSANVLTDLNQPLMLSSDLQTVLHGEVKAFDTQNQVAEIDTDAGPLYLSQISNSVGEHLKVVIHAKDVSVALSNAQDTSILNILPATVEEFKFTENASVILKLRVGRRFILSQITQKSFNQLKIVKQLPLFAQIKAVVLAEIHV
ncbi:molybdenum ABC transporter ATP-binding protein [Aliiglaciecola lipolytica]|uniref:Molybdate transport system ATP-binding protein n=1 Tax=Aliiglaciecola lipolytica E3 TaxID=1127673 RepID=K6YDA8_9ALTE|nr:molybdenum ABC transporter ATP-binding protein [Aliiglaciecola lipolytica]GAC14633.1 molybdate transport system ATP-binding protein [Aliiglaciecola lipolytica E3]